MDAIRRESEEDAVGDCPQRAPSRPVNRGRWRRREGHSAPRKRRSRAPRVAAAVALLGGLLNLLSALLPVRGLQLELLRDVVPGAVAGGARVATAAAGIGLILLAGGLRRRRRLAFVATFVLLAGSSLLHLLKGLNFEESSLDAFFAGLLLGVHDRFHARAPAGERRGVVRPAFAVLVITLGYGIAGLVIDQRFVHARVGLLTAGAAVMRMSVGLSSGLALTGRFGRFFPASVVAVFLVGAFIVVVRAFAPRLVAHGAATEVRDLLPEADDSLAYFATRDDRLAVRTAGAAVSYGIAGSVALAAGDPVGPTAFWEEAVEAFLLEATKQGRVPAVLGCGEQGAKQYALAGLRLVYLGDEATLDLREFSLQGRTRRVARQSWNRAQRAGYTVVVTRTGDLPPADVEALSALSQGWLGNAAERGFSMALGRLFDHRDKDAILVGARDASGAWAGFLHFVPWADNGVSLDVMRRDRAAPAYLNDFLVAEAALRLPDLGVERMSLNFSFLRGVLEAGAAPDAVFALRIERALLQRLSRLFQIETLYRFNRKFDPTWVPRYAALEALEDFPRVVYNALRAEGVLTVPQWGLGR